MVKPEWGMRHVCQDCGVSYYDMNKPQAMCPKCGAKQAKKKAKRKAASTAARSKPRKVALLDPEDENKVVDEDEDGPHGVGLDKISDEDGEVEEGR